MAKKKKKGNHPQQQKLTPERYIKERARKLPFGKCYVNKNWQKEGVAEVVVTRNRTDGNLVLGVYLVDTFCMGVKVAFCNPNITPEKLEDTLHRIVHDEELIQEIPYVEAHNLIYGAIEFAEDAGIPPIKDFGLAKFVLNEDTDDIPLIEYEYGKDGKYLLICGPNNRDKLFVEPLKKKLGDKFDFILPLDSSSDDDDYLGSCYDEMRRHPSEKYAYIHPDYPTILEVKHQVIADEFYNPDYYYSIPDEVIKKILSLPVDEVAQDISNIIMYEIGRTYKAIDEYECDELNHGALLHAIIFLAHLDSPIGLNAILEIMKQNIDFADYHFGDLAPEFIYQALYMVGKNNVETIEKYLYEPGYVSYLRIQAVYALAMIAQNNQERRPGIIDIFRRLLNSMVDRLPRQDACDGEFAGFLMSVLVDLHATELLSEVEKVFATDCVDKTIAGDCDEVIAEINNPNSRYVDHRKPMTIEEQYKRLESFENN